MNKLVVTEDRSHTLLSERFGEHYHSIHGAIQESRHVFIKSGLDLCKVKELHVLEIGFGTGLNALLTYINCRERNLMTHYTTLELYPLSPEEVDGINYPDLLGFKDEFLSMYQAEWNKVVSIDEGFLLEKLNVDLKAVVLEDYYDVVFFDAFSPEVQPELWADDVFRNIADHCNPGAILTTYSAKGAVRRTLQDAGFTVERIPGPPGKREMLRATWG